MLVKDIGGVFGDVGREASKALVMRVASSVKDGRLDVELPDGSRRSFGGKRPGPTASLQVHDDAFFARLVRSGEMGLGESYMEGLWDVDDLTSFLMLGIHAAYHVDVDVRHRVLQREDRVLGVILGAQQSFLFTIPERKQDRAPWTFAERFKGVD